MKLLCHNKYDISNGPLSCVRKLFFLNQNSNSRQIFVTFVFLTFKNTKTASKQLQDVNCEPYKILMLFKSQFIFCRGWARYKKMSLPSRFFTFSAFYKQEAYSVTTPFLDHLTHWGNKNLKYFRDRGLRQGAETGG